MRPFLCHCAAPTSVSDRRATGSAAGTAAFEQSRLDRRSQMEKAIIPTVVGFVSMMGVWGVFDTFHMVVM